MVYTIQAHRKKEKQINKKKKFLVYIFFRTIFNVNLNDIHSFPSNKFELLIGTLNPKWERINA
jgi:hypothetical protein